MKQKDSASKQTVRQNIFTWRQIRQRDKTEARQKISKEKKGLGNKTGSETK